jgi:glycosyltransferase involved in cell wall biosynthesis
MKSWCGKSNGWTSIPEVASVIHGRSTLLCLSHLRWNFVYQRPQHVLSRAARDYDVYFFEEPVFEDDCEPRLDVSIPKDNVTVAVPVLRRGLRDSAVTRLQRGLLDELLAKVKPGELITWYYTPYSLTFSRHLTPNLCVYDNMDELSAFRGASPRLISLERELFRRAHLVFTGGQTLYEAKCDRHHNVQSVPSSIDAHHFVCARSGVNDPPDHAGIPRPRLGYFGVIDERVDMQLIAEIADLRADWHFVMIGPIVKIDATSLPQRPNVHWLGRKAYDELPAYLGSWDIGIMPFAINEATRFISPTKTPEFLAAGLPVVSTPVRDVVRPYGDLGLVEIAINAATFIERAEALFRRPRESWLTEVDHFLANNSWDKTWRCMGESMRRADPRRYRRKHNHPAAAESAHV